MSKDSNDEAQLEIPPEVVMQTKREVRHGVAYIKMYHYLSSFQAVEPLDVTLNGALIMPHRILGSLGYGFTKDQETFCLHTTGFLFDVFSELKPVLANIEYGGLTLKFSELHYADYILPPFLLHFPIANKKIYEMAGNCVSMVITKIEPSLLEIGAEEVVEILNPPIILENKKINGDTSYKKLARIF